MCDSDHMNSFHFVNVIANFCFNHATKKNNFFKEILKMEQNEEKIKNIKINEIWMVNGLKVAYFSLTIFIIYSVVVIERIFFLFLAIFLLPFDM